MSRIEKEETVKKSVCAGYKCDVCGKEVDLSDRIADKSINTITWSHPSGGWGESDSTEVIDICDSIECLNKGLERVYFGATIKLNFAFFDELHKPDEIIDVISNGIYKPTIIRRKDLKE